MAVFLFYRNGYLTYYFLDDEIFHFFMKKTSSHPLHYLIFYSDYLQL